MKSGSKSYCNALGLCLLGRKAVGAVVSSRINLDTAAYIELVGVWFDRAGHRMQAALKEPSGGRAENMKYWGHGVL